MRITLHLIKDDPHAVDMAMLALDDTRKAWQPNWSNRVAVIRGGLTFVVTKTGAGFSAKQI